LREHKKSREEVSVEEHRQPPRTLGASGGGRRAPRGEKVRALVAVRVREGAREYPVD
jgi:hypothetical protein